MASIEADLDVREDVEGASRRVEEVRLAPGSITVVTRREIEAFGYATLTEALRGVRGMFVSDDGFSQSADVRGFSEPGGYCARLLVLLDDKPLNNPYDGGACPGIQTLASLDDVERIEIIRGPSSALFGSSALLATVQVITRRAATDRRAEVRVSTFGATSGRFGARVEAPTPTGAVFASVTTVGESVAANYAQALRAQPSAVGSGDGLSDGHVQGGPVARATTATLGYDSESLHLRVYGHEYERTLVAAPYDVLVGDPRTKTNERRFSFDGRYETPMGFGRAFVRAFGGIYEYDGAYAYAAPIGMEFERFRGSNVGGELRWHGPIAAQVQATIGVEARAQLRARLQSGNEFEGTLLNAVDPATLAGVFGQALLEPAPRTHVTLGTRLDYDPRVPDASLWLFTSPRVAIVNESIPDGTTKLLLGKAFRAATSIERIYEGSGWLPNAGLEPEQVVSAELEHRQNVGRASVLVSAFANRIENLIVLTQPEPDVFQFRNSGDHLVVYGGEAEARITLPRAAFLTAHGSISRQQQTGTELAVSSNVPSWLAGLKFVAPLSSVGVTLAARASLEGGRRLPMPLATGASRTDASARVDLVLGMPVPGVPADVKLGVYNLFDVLTSSVPSASWRQATMPQEGRTLLLSLRFATDG